MCNSDECSTDVYVAERCEHFPMLHIRPARVEDADDLLPIFTQYSSEVSEEYGEFGTVLWLINYTYSHTR